MSRADTPSSSAAAPKQRIDRFLWFVRLAGNRSIAQALCERGIVRLNGRRVERAHVPVRPGDLLTLPMGSRVQVVRVLALPARRGPATEARGHYEFIEPGSGSDRSDVDGGSHEE